MTKPNEATQLEHPALPPKDYRVLEDAINDTVLEVEDTRTLLRQAIGREKSARLALARAKRS